MDELKVIVDNNMIHISELNELSYNVIQSIFDIDAHYTLDTESCDNTVTAWVYGWSIGNTSNDVQIYGEDINDIYSAFDIISRAHNQKYNSKKGKVQKFRVFVHNLTWDFEFLKYSLVEMGFEMYFGDIKFGKKFGTLPPGTFSLVEKDGSIYSANIKLHDTIDFISSRKNKKGEYNVKSIETEIELVDSAKIMKRKLSEIADEVIQIRDIHKKLEGYDYTTIREKGHELTEDEKCYLYNDVYILKEFVKQFYIPLGTTKTTASGIAFEKFLELTFKQKSASDNYKVFESVFPDTTKYAKINHYIKESYQGGMVQGNRKFMERYVDENGKRKTKAVMLNNAVGIDLNSSYPAIVKNKMLPYGLPCDFGNTYDVEAIRRNGYDMEIVTIAFDGFKNNNEDDVLGWIKVGANNIDKYEAYGFDYKASEYTATNIIGGIEKNGVITDYELVGHDKSNSKRRYTMSVWSFELENLLENMSFYIEDLKYDKDLEMWLSKDKLKKGFEIESVVAFKGHTGMFGEAVDHYAQEKIQGKKDKNACKTENAKMMLNSFYGKMGSIATRQDRAMQVTEDGQIKYTSAVNTYTSNKKYYMAYASAVTAWGRVVLRESLYKIGYQNILYFDTDSLYTTITEEELKARCGEILDDLVLGKWKIEKTYNKFKCLGAKKYILEDVKGNVKTTCAGLPSDVTDQCTFENFELGAQFTGKKQKCAIKGGYILTDEVFTIIDERY